MKNQSQVISRVYGQNCWRVWRGYGSSLFFELGDVQFTHKSNEARRGKYSLCLDMCRWQILRRNQEVVNSAQDFAEIDSAVKRLEPQKLVKIQILAHLKKTQISFSNDLVILTDHSAPKNQWYLLTPVNELVVGQNCAVDLYERRD
jgi:hypothetical protein